MENLTISLRDSNQFPDIVCDYNDRVPFLSSFYKYTPDLTSYDEVIANRTFSSSKREVLVQALLNQYQQAGIVLEQYPLVHEHIQKLRNENTFTVTTGHQLCLLTGPLYFHFKILTTIKLALSLSKRYPQHHFVPVFWMASEDHDFAEINHVHVFNKKYEWETNPNDKPVGEIELDSLQPLLDELGKLANTEESKQVLQEYTEPYRNSKTLAEATLKLVHHLFSKHGLVVIEPNQAILKKEFTKEILHDILTRENVVQLRNTTQQLTERYKAQINGRDINFFYLGNNGRKLLRYENRLYGTSDNLISFTEEQMKSEIVQFPERFSPNVVMRPLYQEAILPNLAYIGGPGEIAYWLQLKEVFTANQIDFPVLQLRESFIVMGAGLMQKINKTGLSIEAFLQPEKQLADAYLNSLSESGSLHELITDIINRYQTAIDAIPQEETQLRSELIKIKTEQAKVLAKINSQIQSNRKERAGSALEKLNKLRSSLLPNGHLAERWDNILTYILNHKDQHALYDQIMEQPFPDKNAVSIIKLG